MLRFLPTIASSGTVQAKSQRNSPAELWAIILSVCHQASPRFFHYLDRLQQPTKSVIGQSYSNGNTAPCLRACVRASPAPSHRFRAACAWCRCWRIPSPLLVLAGAPHACRARCARRRRPPTHRGRRARRRRRRMPPCACPRTPQQDRISSGDSPAAPRHRCPSWWRRTPISSRTSGCSPRRRTPRAPLRTSSSRRCRATRST